MPADTGPYQPADWFDAPTPAQPENDAERTAVLPPVTAQPAPAPSRPATPPAQRPAQRPAPRPASPRPAARPYVLPPIEPGRTLPAFPLIEPNVSTEPFQFQVVRLLRYLATLVRAGQLAPGDVFAAIETAPDTDTFSKWMALKRISLLCRQHAYATGWVRSQPPSRALPGDWLAGLIAHVDNDAVAEMLSVAAEANPSAA